MAEQLGDRVRLGAGVRSLDELDADHVILAVPLPALRAFELPDWKRAALDRVEMGHAAKLHVPLARPALTSAVMSVPDRYWCWTTSGTPTVLNCFAGSPPRSTGLVAEAAWLARGRVTLRPDLSLADDAVLTTWPRAPTARPACAPGPATRSCSPRPPGACGSRASTPRGRGPG